MTNAKPTNWMAVVEEIGPRLAEVAPRHDAEGSFVADSYELLERHRLMSAMVPRELGGGGASHREMCDVLRRLAHYCSSTALSLSMHQHLVAANVFKHRRGEPGAAVLEKVAAKELVLVSTGARDWMESNGSMRAVDGGFRVSARKAFASGSPAGDVLVTSAPYDDPNDGPLVLHFPVPLSAEGVRIEDDWDTLGMRGTGSNAVVLEDVFVPAESIALRRPRGPFHGAFNVILTVAMPLISSVYCGVAEAAQRAVLDRARHRDGDALLPLALGELENHVTAAQVALASMIDLANDFDFEPTLERSNAVLVRKTLVVEAALAATETALEASGGAGFYRRSGIERLLRDAHAGQFHPLPARRQQLFTGRLALGLDPIG